MLPICWIQPQWAATECVRLMDFMAIRTARFTHAWFG